MRAAATLVPNERRRALTPFDAPVSLCGTERMIIMGMPAKPNPIPSPTRKLEMKMSHTDESEIASMP